MPARRPCRYSVYSARQMVWRETPKVLATTDWDCPLRRSSRMAAVWWGLRTLCSTRRLVSAPHAGLKRPAHPDGQRCGVPQFAGVLSAQGQDAPHNGGRLGAAPHTLVDEKAGEDVAQGAVGPGQPETPLPGLLPHPAVATK